MRYSKSYLEKLRGLSLDNKIMLSKARIRQFYIRLHGKVYVSFSGGKDSTVLLHLVRSLFPDVEAVYVDTGLEYPEIRSFVKENSNVTWLTPKLHFTKVIEKYGFPVISKDNSQKIYEINTTKSDKLKNKRLYGDSKGNGKLPEKWKPLLNASFAISHKCCDIMKKNPAKAFEKLTSKYPITGEMASEARLREQSFLMHGCNMFDSGRPKSRPLSFWSDSDIWAYIRKYNLKYSPIYDMGYERTGCMFCLFGYWGKEKVDRFELMKKSHPKQYKYCMEKLGLREVIDKINCWLSDGQGKLF